MQNGILNLDAQTLSQWLQDHGQPRYRAKQLRARCFDPQIASFDEMTDLPVSLREALKADFILRETAVEQCRVSADGTRKFLFRLPDGERVEGVLMGYKHGNSVCISTQAGCKMGCRFCASPPEGFCRNLTPGELLGQVMQAGLECPAGRVDSVVLMGIGEPLDNFDNVVRFLGLLSDPDGFGMSLRHVSLSTCGQAEAVERLAEYGFPLTLSLSLHAPDDAVRDRLMPINRVYNIARLMAACDVWLQKVGRRVCIEYALIAGLNDSPAQAKQLAALIGRRLCHVNLIRYNPVVGTGFLPSPPASAQRFARILTECGCSVTIRRTLGSDLDASCGQLRRSRQTALRNPTGGESQ